MIRPLSWERWSQLYLHKKNKKRTSLERHGLRNLHSVSSLDSIVSKVHELYFNKKQTVAVNAKSVWVDGTPQAKFKTVDGSFLNCELADLLFITHEMYGDRTTKNCRAILLQAKCSEKYNLLPNGTSTDKERKLLESIDRNEYLTLYPGTKAYGHSIGSYKLNGNVMGLPDCAKYLMMPKYEKWKFKTPEDISPYVIGWPEGLNSKVLINNKNYIDSIISEMIFSKSIGKDIILNMGVGIDRCCEWSRMVDDLLHCYLPVIMKGYDCQRRVYESSSFDDNISDALRLIDEDCFIPISGDELEGVPNSRDSFLFQYTVNNLIGRSGPAIPTIYIQIKYMEDDN